MKYPLKILFLLLTAWVFACNPNLDDDDILPDDNNNANNSQNTNGQGSMQTGHGSTIKPACNLIAYSDTLFFLENLKDDLKVKPLVKRDGEYGAYPEGLEINESHGEINITKSESGLRYTVFFIPKNTKDSCFTHLTIS